MKTERWWRQCATNKYDIHSYSLYQRMNELFIPFCILQLFALRRTAIDYNRQ